MRRKRSRGPAVLIPPPPRPSPSPRLAGTRQAGAQGRPASWRAGREGGGEQGAGQEQCWLPARSWSWGLRRGEGLESGVENKDRRVREEAAASPPRCTHTLSGP